MNNISAEELVKWRDVIKSDLESAKNDLVVAQKRYQETEERFSLIERLLVLENSKSQNKSDEIFEHSDLLSECENILRNHGGPMHINEIHNSLIQKAVPIPGRGTKANVIARLQRSDGRIIRTGRGEYSLPEFGIPEMKPTKKRRTSTKRVS